MCEKAAFQSFNLTSVLHQALPCHPAKVPLLLSEKATMKALLLCARSILWERRARDRAIPSLQK